MTDRSGDHLVHLHGGWSAWRLMRLRGAGFPAALIDEAALPDAIPAIDRYFAAQASVTTACEAALAACTVIYERTERDHRKPLVKILKRLRAGAVPEVSEDPEVEAALGPARRAAHTVEVAWQAVESAFERSRLSVAGALRRVVVSDRFREAVTWQNRHALRNGLSSLADIPIEAVDKDTRKREQAVASYLQRYCVKNDTISFFGPVSWGTFRDDVTGAVLEPGAELLANRTVFYEHWCMNALAQHLAEDAQLLPWLKPRRAPTLRVAGDVLHAPGDQRTTMNPPVARLLAACEGERAANDIARELVADAALELEDEDEVYALLAALVDDGLVTWTLELSPEELYPERWLRAAIDGVGDADVRARALAKLDLLADARARVARAAGDPVALEAAMGAFEQSFSSLTGVASTRKPGETYGGRTLLYEDCRRDVTFTLGRDVVERLGPPLALLLDSARWYTYTIAQRYRAAIQPIYEALRDETGDAVIEFRRFWDRIRALFPPKGAPSIVEDVTVELHARWRAVLGLEPGQRRCERTCEALRAQVASSFHAPSPGWPMARYQSPDLLIAASSIEAVSRGDYLVVVGEIHTGLNSVLVPVFVKEYPDAEALVRAREQDITRPCIAPVWSHERSRADMFSLARHDISLENGATRSWRPRTNVIQESSLVVEQRDGRVEVRTRDGAHRFDIIAFVEHHLIAQSHAEFTIIGRAPHAPRVTVDGVVFSRERWQLVPSDIPFVHLDSPLDRFVGARRWAQAMGLPRRIFIKVPDETKPMYVDLESSVFVDNMARMVRKATAVTISEMLPDLEQTWLVDSSGSTYTSEIRMVAVDETSFVDPV